MISRQSWSRLGDELVAGVFRQQIAGELHVARTELIDPTVELCVLSLGEVHEIQERIGHARGTRTAPRPCGGAGSASMIEATRRMQTASATLEPPNLWTFQASKPLTLCSARARTHGGPSGDGPDRDPARIRRMQCNSLYLLAAQQAN